MKLLFTSYNSSPEYQTPEAWLSRIAFFTGIMESLGRSHSVTAIEHIDYEGKLQKQGVNYIFIRLKRKVIRFPFRKHQVIRKLEPDVVFINGFIFPLQIIQLRLHLGSKPKIIILHRAEKPFSGYKRILQRFADKFITAYFFTSVEFRETWMRHGIIRQKEKVYEIIQSSSIFYSADKTTIKEQPGQLNGANFLWVGRLDKNKDPLTVVKAFIYYLAHSPKSELHMIYQGGDLMEEVRLMLNEPGAGKSIKLLGPIPHTQLGYYFSAADFIISGSHYEGSGIAILEGMSCGCIPLLTNIASFRKITNYGMLGFLYEAGNPSSLLNILMKTNEIDRRLEQERIRNYFHDELSFEAIARKTEIVLEKITTINIADQRGRLYPD